MDDKLKYISNWGCFIYNENATKLKREQYESYLVKNLSNNKIGRIVYINTINSMDDIRFITNDLSLEYIENNAEFKVLNG